MESVLDVFSAWTPGSLLEDPRSVEGPEGSIYLVLLAVFAVVFLAGLLSSLLSNRLHQGNRLHQDVLYLTEQGTEVLTAADA